MIFVFVNLAQNGVQWSSMLPSTVSGAAHLRIDSDPQTDRIIVTEERDLQQLLDGIIAAEPLCATINLDLPNNLGESFEYFTSKVGAGKYKCYLHRNDSQQWQNQNGTWLAQHGWDVTVYTTADSSADDLSARTAWTEVRKTLKLPFDFELNRAIHALNNYFATFRLLLKSIPNQAFQAWRSAFFEALDAAIGGSQQRGRYWESLSQANRIFDRWANDKDEEAVKQLQDIEFEVMKDLGQLFRPLDEKEMDPEALRDRLDKWFRQASVVGSRLSWQNKPSASS